MKKFFPFKINRKIYRQIFLVWFLLLILFGFNVFSVQAQSWKIYRNSEDQQFRIQQGGSDKLVITPAGHVGIGTTAPGAAKLSVVGDIHLLNNGGVNSLEILANGALPTRRGISLDPDPNGAFNFYIHQWQANAAFNFIEGEQKKNLMTIRNDGNVGIGTMAPQAKLDVAGQVKVTNLEVTNQVKIAGGSPGQGKILISDNSGLATWGEVTNIFFPGQSGQTLRYDGSIKKWVANSLLFNNGNRIGIGTTSPAALLHLQSFSGDIGLRLTVSKDGSASPMIMWDSTKAGANRVYWMRQESNDWVFYVSDTNYDNQKLIMTADTSGNVGIGTMSPAAKLDVKGFIVADGLGRGTCTLVDSRTNGGDLWCPSGYYVAGARNTPGNNWALDQIWCCPLR